MAESPSSTQKSADASAKINAAQLEPKLTLKTANVKKHAQLQLPIAVLTSGLMMLIANVFQNAFLFLLVSLVAGTSRLVGAKIHVQLQLPTAVLTNGLMMSTADVFQSVFPSLPVSLAAGTSRLANANVHHLHPVLEEKHGIQTLVSASAMEWLFVPLPEDGIPVLANVLAQLSKTAEPTSSGTPIAVHASADPQFVLQGLLGTKTHVHVTVQLKPVQAI